MHRLSKTGEWKKNLKGQVEWRLIQSTRQLWQPDFFPPSPLPDLLMWTEQRFKVPLFKISHLHVGGGGLINKCYGSPWVWSSEPYLLLLVSACGCVFLSLWRCKGSMVGHTSAHTNLGAYTLAHTRALTHTQTKILKHTAPCNKETKNNRHLLLKPQCLQWSQIRAFPWQQ